MIYFRIHSEISMGIPLEMPLWIQSVTSMELHFAFMIFLEILAYIQQCFIKASQIVDLNRPAE